MRPSRSESAYTHTHAHMHGRTAVSSEAGPAWVAGSGDQAVQAARESALSESPRIGRQPVLAATPEYEDSA